jgi:hypothetical protein
MNIIVTTPDELRSIIKEAVREAVKETGHVVETKNLPDNITLKTAIEVLKEHGYPTSKGKIYKLTSSGEMPFRKYGNKLVFSRKGLITWAESRTRRVDESNDATLSIAPNTSASFRYRK